MRRELELQADWMTVRFLGIRQIHRRNNIDIEYYCTYIMIVTFKISRLDYIPFHPIGIIAAAISETPRSVASRLNCAAAFLVSTTSTLTPSELICFLVSGESGMIEPPIPRINRSGGSCQYTQKQGKDANSRQNKPGRGHTRSKMPQACSPTSNCPLALTIPLLFPVLLVIHGLHVNASPPTSITPSPPDVLTPLSR